MTSRHLTATVPSLALATLAALAGCEASTATNAFEATDSAGIRIATNTTLAAPEWRLADPPRLDLGTTDEAGPEQFFRVSAGRVLPDGRVAVVNSGSREVRVFGADGRHLFTIGGDGEGPGEFRAPYGIWAIHGDSLAVWDQRLRRLSVFSAEGGFGRAVMPDLRMVNATPVVVFSDGGMVLKDDLFDFPTTGMRQQYSSYTRIDAGGAVVDTLPRQPLIVMGVLETGSGTPSVGEPIFAARTAVAGAPDGYWVGLGLEEEVRQYDAGGATSLIVRWPTGDRTVQPGAAERAIEDGLAGIPEAQQPRVRRWYEARPVSDAYPAYDRIVPGRDGGVWVEEYQRPGDEGGSRWLVFGPGGRFLAHVATPSDHRVLDIGPDAVLAVGTDELGVEHVRLFRLLREE